MKNKINILNSIGILTLLILIVLVIAEVYILTESRLNIEVVRLNMLKEKVGIPLNQDLNLDIDLKCVENECHATIFYPNLINTDWYGNKIYCSEYEVYEVIRDISYNPECLVYSEYTIEQIQEQVNNYSKERLNQYADYLINEYNKINTEVDVANWTLVLDN